MQKLLNTFVNFYIGNFVNFYVDINTVKVLVQKCNLEVLQGAKK